MSRSLQRSDTFIAVPPGVMKLAEVEQKTVEVAIPHLQAFFKYLELTNEMHLETCFGKSVSMSSRLVATRPPPC